MSGLFCGVNHTEGYHRFAYSEGVTKEEGQLPHVLKWATQQCRTSVKVPNILCILMYKLHSIISEQTPGFEPLSGSKQHLSKIKGKLVQYGP